MTGIPGTFLNDKAGILAEFSCECPLPSYKSWTETGKENFQWSTWSPQRDQWQIEIPIAESREGDELGRHIRLTLLTKAFESDILVARLSIVSTLKEPILQKEILGFNYSYSSAIFFFSSEGVNSQLNATGGLAIRLEVFKLKFTAESRPPLVQVCKLMLKFIKWIQI